MSTRLHTSILMIVCLVLPVCAYATDSYAPRVEFGARLEPSNRIIHGAGQDAKAFTNYAMCFDEDHQPLIYMTYISLTIPVENIVAWGSRLKLELEAHSPVKPIPQIGLSFVGGNDTGLNLDAEVSEGKFDAQIMAFADALASLNRPVFLRIGYEFEGKWNHYQPITFQRAWKRITQKLRERNLHFATVWCVAGGSSDWPPMVRLMEFYPGDEYVDWWGVDLFSANELNHPRLDVFLDVSRKHRKPVMIGEMTPRHIGVLDGQKSWNAWFDPMIELLKRRPEIKATAYINWEWAEQSDLLNFKWHKWGDARIEKNEMVRKRWVKELTDPIYLHATRDGSLPLPPVDSVKIDSLSLKTAFADHFLMGAALNVSHFTQNDTAKAALIKKHFNTITPENVLKWGLIHPELDRFDFEAADQYVEFGDKNQMFTIGHALIWHQQTPAWVFQDSQGKPLDRDALLARMGDHISSVVGRYKGRIVGWDVVNEALNDDGSLRKTAWLNIIGPDYLEKAFAFAHAADPNAELYYNDYSLEKPAKRDAAVALIKQLQAAGIRISGIGSQTHVALESPSLQSVEDSLVAFGQLGVKVMITELDVSVLPAAKLNQSADVGDRAAYDAALNPYPVVLPQEIQEKLAARYADLFAIFVKHADKLSRVTFWGVTDDDSWLNNWPMKGRVNYPLLFDRANQPKSAFDAVMRVGNESTRLIDPRK